MTVLHFEPCRDPRCPIDYEHAHACGHYENEMIEAALIRRPDKPHIKPIERNTMEPWVEPTVGRVILVYGLTRHNGRPIPAIINWVHSAETGMIDAFLLPSPNHGDISCHARTSIPHITASEVGMHWDWPPRVVTPQVIH